MSKQVVLRTIATAVGLFAAVGTTAAVDVVNHGSATSVDRPRMAPLEYASTSEARRLGLDPQSKGESMARIWNEELLFAIRRDFARPTIHARNLYHISAAMWDAWAAFDDHADQVLHDERMSADDVLEARNEAIAFATYRIMRHRFGNSPGVVDTFAEIDMTMDNLGYDRTYTALDEDNPASLGNRIAQSYILYGLTDGSNEIFGHINLKYFPINLPLVPQFAGNPDITDVNRWQPLSLEFFVDQSGNPIPGGVPEFLSPEWGDVDGFALKEESRITNSRFGFDFNVWHDPGPPPYFNGEGDEEYRRGFAMVSVWSGHLDPTLGHPSNPTEGGPYLIDISPASLGNAELPARDEWDDYYRFIEGGDWGQGWDTNPATGEAYEPQMVPLGDYGRVLAEFWADGPDSETPPGHWFTIMNFVSDHPMFEKRYRGQGEILDDLEWDVKAYLSMGGTMHDSAIAAWSVKGWYDYLRPISAVRWMADQGQSSDPDGPSYSPDGIPLVENYIAVVTPETTAPGGIHRHLLGNEGKIALFAWNGPDAVTDPLTETAGVGWILAERWWPYQRPSFVTPPFAGYVSGHSTYSRAASIVMTELTGSEFFPGGVGEFLAPANNFLVFEQGPSMDVVLQWATYQDASDQTSLSRIWGGIHPRADDIPGREIGDKTGPQAFFEAERYFTGRISCPADWTGDRVITGGDVMAYLDAFNAQSPAAELAAPFDQLDFFDVLEFLRSASNGCPE